MPFISIIVPVYNIEKYIIPCLRSIKAQNFDDYELIIVNDGSTDTSGRIVSDYAEKEQDSRICVINKENGGLCSARNAALNIAKGEWVTFIDGDDWVEPDYLNELVKNLEKYPSDLSIGGYQAVDEKTSETEVWSHYTAHCGKIPEDLKHLHSFGVVWGRLYKRSVIEENNIRFDERIRYAEDKAWQYDYNKYIKSFCCTDKILYNYRVSRDGSLTSGLVTPQMKYHISEHAMAFYKSFKDEELEDALKNNIKFSSSAWTILTTHVVNLILRGDYKLAKQEKEKAFSKKVMKYHIPRSKKEKIFNLFWKLPFVFLIVLSKVYYGNFEKLRRSKFISSISASR